MAPVRYNPDVQVFHFDTIDSTNAAAKRLLRAGEISDVALIVVREQTHGRGTRDRAWISPVGAGIYMTVVMRVDASVCIAPRTVTPAVGAACVDVLRDATQRPIEQRGVNDLYFDDRKLGGILTEAMAEAGVVDAVLVGVGINIRAGAVKLPPDDPTRPIALEEITPGRDWSGDEVDRLTMRLAEAICNRGVPGR